MGEDGLDILLQWENWVASIFTWPQWEISTLTVSWLTGRGCFHGSPSILMYVWSFAPSLNSKQTLFVCIRTRRRKEEILGHEPWVRWKLSQPNFFNLNLSKTGPVSFGSKQYKPMPSISETNNLDKAIINKWRSQVSLHGKVILTKRLTMASEKIRGQIVQWNSSHSQMQLFG